MNNIINIYNEAQDYMKLSRKEKSKYELKYNRSKLCWYSNELTIVNYDNIRLNYQLYTGIIAPDYYPCGDIEAKKYKGIKIIKPKKQITNIWNVLNIEE